MKECKNQKESLSLFVNICFRPIDMTFQSFGNLKKKHEKDIKHFVPL